MEKFILVGIIILITLSTALILDTSAKKIYVLNFFSIVIISIVFVLNIIKFKIWGIVHKKFPLNKTYPLTSLFFPLIYIVSIWKGESYLEINKIFGILLIILGIYVMHIKGKKDDY